MKGLLFIPEMARAAFEGRKTNTRRVMNPQPGRCVHDFEERDPGVWHFEGDSPTNHGGEVQMNDWSCDIKCDYLAGERRCLLTTWSVPKGYDGLKPTEIEYNENLIRYLWHAGMGTPKPEWAGKLRPGRFLPNHLRSFMPIFEIVTVRVERIQDITPDDCRAEGMTAGNNDVGVRYGFGQLWNSINEKRGFGWGKNPWVWAISFRRILPSVNSTP